MRYWAAGLLLTVLLFGGGWLSSGAAPDVSRSVPGADPGQTGENAGQPAADANTVLRVWDGEQVVEMTMAEYLPGVVRGEMPAAFHQQALDAQAVAERTFIYYHMASGRKAAHPDADVCMDYRCCNAYTSAQAAAEKWGDHAAEYEAKVQQAVRDTDGQVILYNGQPILAAFHSSSAGVTANSGDVWVSTLPYLHSVESPEGEDTVPNYYSVQEIPAAEFQQTFLAAHPEASFAGAPETWITGRVENASGRVESICIGGVTVEGDRGPQPVRSAVGVLHCGGRGGQGDVSRYRLRPRCGHEPIRGQPAGPGGEVLAGDSPLVLHRRHHRPLRRIGLDERRNLYYNFLQKHHGRRLAS